MVSRYSAFVLATYASYPGRLAYTFCQGTQCAGLCGIAPLACYCLVFDAFASCIAKVERARSCYLWMDRNPSVFVAGLLFQHGAHPARNPFLLWGLLPNTDSHYYLNNAVEIAEGIGIRASFGARQMWPGFLALLHTGCGGDLKLMYRSLFSYKRVSLS